MPFTLVIKRYQENGILTLPTFDDGKVLWYDHVHDVLYGGKKAIVTDVTLRELPDGLVTYHDAHGVLVRFHIGPFSSWIYNHRFTELAELSSLSEELKTELQAYREEPNGQT